MVKRGNGYCRITFNHIENIKIHGKKTFLQNPMIFSFADSFFKSNNSCLSPIIHGKRAFLRNPTNFTFFKKILNSLTPYDNLAGIRGVGQRNRAEKTAII